MTRKTETVAHLDASIKRWKTRLKRSVTMIDKLEKKRRRIEIKAYVDTEVVKARATKTVVFEPEVLGPTGPNGPMCPGAVGVPDLDIPEFLRRGQAAQAAADDVIAAEKIKTEQAAKAKAKAAGRIAKMKAKKSGDLKKMPLSGKAALDHIDNG